jgi:hypothetical protein
MADRWFACPRHGVQDFATLSLQHVINSENSIGFDDPVSFHIHLVLGGNIHRNVDRHRCIKFGIGEGQVRGISLLEARQELIVLTLLGRGDFDHFYERAMETCARYTSADDQVLYLMGKSVRLAEYLSIGLEALERSAKAEE